MVKILKQILFVTALSLCAFLTAFAQQKDDDNKTPPKTNPPVVVVKPKESEKPKGDDKSGDAGKGGDASKRKDGNKKPKKPQASISDSNQQIEVIFD